MDIKDKVKQQFGLNAQKYVTSQNHAQGTDLAYLLDCVEFNKDSIALDIATGGGHVANALAPLVSEVVAVDLTPEILAAAQKFINGNGFSNVSFIQADAENLPFEAGMFDVVTCRIAAHHFPHVTVFMQEVQRVLKPGGVFVLIDNAAPESELRDEFYNQIEKRRDASHVRAWKKSEWLNMFEAAGLSVDLLKVFKKSFNYNTWCDMTGLSTKEKEDLALFFLQASEDIKQHFDVQSEHGKIQGFHGEAMLLKAYKF